MSQKLKSKYKTLNLGLLRRKNIQRNLDVFPKCSDWSSTDWATAMAGECGEICNLIKKMRMGNTIDLDEVGKELADLIIYIDLLANHLGINLSTSLIQKFNEVSDKRGSKIKLN